MEKFRVVESNKNDMWEHGMPENYYDSNTDQGIEYGFGDETVPFSSAGGIASDKEIPLNSPHGDLPTASRCDVFRELSGNQDCFSANVFDRVTNILTFGVFSPVDIQIESPSGKRIGKNFETGEEINEIEGAFYTGHDTDNEFVTIPNPGDGEYKIKTQGTDEGGNFGVEVVKISENPEDPDNVKEFSAMIEGGTQPGEKQETGVEVSGDEVIYNPDKTPPAITVSSPENMDYTNDKVLTIDYSVEDKESGVENDSWQVEKDGQILDWKEKSVDLSLEHLGNYVFKVSATDKAGNSADEQVEFQITTGLDAMQNNLKHYFDLGLVKNKIALKYFSVKLKNLEKLFGLLEKAKNSKPKPKQAAIEALEKVINKNIEMIIRQLKQKSPRWVDGRARDLMIESLSAIRIK